MLEILLGALELKAVQLEDLLQVFEGKNKAHIPRLKKSGLAGTIVNCAGMTAYSHEIAPKLGGAIAGSYYELRHKLMQFCFPSDVQKRSIHVAHGAPATN